MRFDILLSVNVYEVATFGFVMTATDKANAVSSYQPELRICDCVNGVCDFTDLSYISGNSSGN